MKTFKLPKMPIQINELLKNQTVLYIVFFIAVANVLGYLRYGNIKAIIFFITFAFLSTYFSKNIIIDLLIAIVLTNLFFSYRVNKPHKQEGMENMDEANQEEEEEEYDEAFDEPADDIDDNAFEDVPQQEPEQENVNTAHQDGFTNKKNKTKNNKVKQGFRPKSKSKGVNYPTSVPAGIDDDEDIGKRIDYASTLEQAYDNLQNMLGKDGIKGLTKETETLINQQKNLMGTITEIQPLIKTAKDTLSTLNLGDLNKGISSITNMISGIKG
jgi:hypothetical protein